MHFWFLCVSPCVPTRRLAVRLHLSPCCQSSRVLGKGKKRVQNYVYQIKGGCGLWSYEGVCVCVPACCCIRQVRSELNCQRVPSCLSPGRDVFSFFFYVDKRWGISCAPSLTLS